MSAPRPLILIVEDEFVSAKAYWFVLEQLRCDVVYVSRCSSARIVARALVPDVAILDIKLPDGNGCDLSNQLRALPGWQRVPLIAISALPEDTSRPDSFTRRVAKPVTSNLEALLGEYVPGLRG